MRTWLVTDPAGQEHVVAEIKHQVFYGAENLPEIMKFVLPKDGSGNIAGYEFKEIK